MNGALAARRPCGSSASSVATASCVAVRGIDLAIADGEFFSLLGPSGCGKTTTLRLISGLEEPTVGRVEVHGRDMTRVPPHRRPVTTVFQNYALFPHLNVFENVAFGLRERRVARAELRSRVARLLELVDLSGRDTARPRELSGGQQQRVALARSLVLNPEVLLLDEPLGALDLKLRKQLQGLLKSVQREVGITFVYVTHDQEEAFSMSDRVAVMNLGRVEQIGGPREVYARPSTLFVAQFVGASNHFPARVVEVLADGRYRADLGAARDVAGRRRGGPRQRRRRRRHRPPRAGARRAGTGERPGEIAHLGPRRGRLLRRPGRAPHRRDRGRRPSAASRPAAPTAPRRPPLPLGRSDVWLVPRRRRGDVTFALAARCELTGAFGACAATADIAVGARVGHVEAGVGAILTQHRDGSSPRPARARPAPLGVRRDRDHRRRSWPPRPSPAGASSRPSMRPARSAAFSGAEVVTTSAEQHGPGCVAIGNMLAHAGRCLRDARGLRGGRGAPLAERLVRALEGGAAAGGETGRHAVGRRPGRARPRHAARRPPHR